MENNCANAKRLSPEEQYLLRRSIVGMARKGIKSRIIADALGVSMRLVQATMKTYNEEGIEGIKPKQRGRKHGDKRTMTAEQEKMIIKIITEKNPDQMKLRCCMWTRKSVRDLIKRACKIEMPLVSVGVYLRRWGFSVQRPIKRANKQDGVRIQAWMEEEYPAIAEQAKAEKAEIYWGDETALQNTSNTIKGYAPIGKTPVVEVEARRMKLNMLSAVSNRGKLRFTITKDSVNADILIDFMKRLVKDTGRKVLLILDNLRVHHAKKVTAWLADHKAEIELFFLPPYAPEYNPDEYLNSDMKRAMEKKPMPRTEADIERNARSFLKEKQLNPDHVKSYFKHECVKYAN